MGILKILTVTLILLTTIKVMICGTFWIRFSINPLNYSKVYSWPDRFSVLFSAILWALASWMLFFFLMFVEEFILNS